MGPNTQGGQPGCNCNVCTPAEPPPVKDRPCTLLGV
ncbi:hypothetical protein GBAR_LOCUS21037 [Geodia barretti]|uniref:Uncharacterized protein n=1 Tax=Geodia barretti TaxID=519541 RepID=A0AA35X4L8_GEOBA|nr:hypothetical protein GBAR_LOCUS21037 [Geodia barretti]